MNNKVGQHSNEDPLRSAAINKPLASYHETSKPKIDDTTSKKLSNMQGIITIITYICI